ncbi:TusA-related sulfurtransferase [Fluviicoccus keumensis]|uniref:TusA-related sulfurtransferase n=1 Tax=Fluviicoccus keumensis TaxID=1435465 RepID=A0A4Q7Z9Q9_9GAMM|nr:sulfurtransferase TusA family protein [Fluviicoccus keumensis]RZU47287.1 TusA-related sulfurtransferase [Fluviicoccus keumensis]
MSEFVADIVVDARRLLCPMPVIRTQAAVRKLTAGQCVEVLTTDPGALHDIPAWCRVQGHEYLGCEQAGRELRLRLKV